MSSSTALRLFVSRSPAEFLRLVAREPDCLRSLIAAYRFVLRTHESVQAAAYGVGQHADPGNVPIETPHPAFSNG